MARKHRRRERSGVPHSSVRSPQLQRPEIRKIVGMFSIKTIRGRSGSVIIRQGEVISEELFRDNEAQERLDEIAANAMAGKGR